MIMFPGSPLPSQLFACCDCIADTHHSSAVSCCTCFIIDCADGVDAPGLSDFLHGCTTSCMYVCMHIITHIAGIAIYGR
jgi:hypothetical protein